jgi:hypothetical protein
MMTKEDPAMPDQLPPSTANDEEAAVERTPETITRAAASLEEAIAAPQGGPGSDAGPAADAVTQTDLDDLSSQLGERGVDFGGLLTAMMAASGQTRPKPAAAKEPGEDEDAAVLLAKLAKSLGISPAELMRRLGPMLKEILATGSVKPRRKPKKETAKPKPGAKPKSKPKPASKPKPTPKPASKPKKDAKEPAGKPKPKPKPASKPKKEAKKPAGKPKPKPKKAGRAEPIAQ